MTKKEINQKEIDDAKSFRNIGYTFKSLVANTIMQNRYTFELEQRLRLIDEMDGKVCLCSAMVGDQEKEGNTVPLLYCVITEGKSRIKNSKVCAYFKPTVEQLGKALFLHGELNKSLQ